MDIEKILDHPLINKSELARRMYPNKETKAPAFLHMKIKNMQRSQVTQKDRELIQKIIDDFIEEIKSE